VAALTAEVAAKQAALDVQTARADAAEAVPKGVPQEEFDALKVCVWCFFEINLRADSNFRVQTTHDSILDRNTKLNQVSLQFKNKNIALTTKIKELETTIETLQAQLTEASAAAAAASASAAAPAPSSADDKPALEALQKKIAELTEKETKVGDGWWRW
jgi:hypothetical protein